MAEALSYWLCNCGQSNANGERKCKSCAGKRPRGLGFYSAIAAAALIVIVLILPAAKNTQGALPTAPMRPSSQIAFIATIDMAQEHGINAWNTLAVSTILKQRDADIAYIGSVNNWRGNVIGINRMRGKGAVKIKVGDAALVAGVHEMKDLETLIEPGSEIYSAIQTMRQGDVVELSGRFVINGSLPVELSYTDTGSLEEPEFLFRFEQLTVIE
jgi:hypothetical protein